MGVCGSICGDLPPVGGRHITSDTMRASVLVSYRLNSTACPSPPTRSTVELTHPPCSPLTPSSNSSLRLGMVRRRVCINTDPRGRFTARPRPPRSADRRARVTVAGRQLLTTSLPCHHPSEPTTRQQGRPTHAPLEQLVQ